MESSRKDQEYEGSLLERPGSSPWGDLLACSQTVGVQLKLHSGLQEADYGPTPDDGCNSNHLVTVIGSTGSTCDISWFNQTLRELLRGDGLISTGLEAGRFTGLELSAGDYVATSENPRIKPTLNTAELKKRKVSRGLMISLMPPDQITPEAGQNPWTFQLCEPVNSLFSLGLWDLWFCFLQMTEMNTETISLKQLHKYSMLVGNRARKSLVIEILFPVSAPVYERRT